MRRRRRTQAEGRGAAVVGLTRSGLLTRTLALSGALAGSAVAAEIAASSGSQPSAARDRQILSFGLLIERLQAAFYADALRGGRLTGETRQFAQHVGHRSRRTSSIVAAALGSSARQGSGLSLWRRGNRSGEVHRDGGVARGHRLAVYNGQGVNLTAQALAAAARLVSVEARHAAWARALAGELPAPVAVDVPITVASGQEPCSTDSSRSDVRRHLPIATDSPTSMSTERA